MFVKVWEFQRILFLSGFTACFSKVWNFGYGVSDLC